MNTSDHIDLINTYVHVCNQALLQNKDRFPFKQILGAVREAEKGCVVEVNVAGSLSLGSFVFSLSEAGVFAKPHGDCLNCDCDRTWNVSKAYLEEVARNPQVFIQNPAKIDWEWMRDV